MRGVVGARAEPHVPRLGRVGRFLVAQHPDRLVGKVFGQVIALFRAVGLLDEPVVLGQVRVPVVGLPAEEPVEPIEALLQRPRRLVAAAGDVLFGNVVVLADPEGAVAVVLQHLTDGGALRGQSRGGAGETVGALGDRREPVDMVIASGEETRPGRRAQRGGVPLRVHHPVVGQALHHRHLDATAVGRPGSHPGVVVEHHQNIRRTLGCALEFERLPVRRRVADVEFDLAVEALVDAGAIPGRARVGGSSTTLAGAAPRGERRRRGGARAGDGYSAENLASRHLAAGALGVIGGQVSVVAVVHGVPPQL